MKEDKDIKVKTLLFYIVIVFISGILILSSESQEIHKIVAKGIGMLIFVVGIPSFLVGLFVLIYRLRKKVLQSPLRKIFVNSLFLWIIAIAGQLFSN